MHSQTLHIAHTVSSFASGDNMSPPLHLAVLAALYQENVLSEHDVQELKEKAHGDESIFHSLIGDLLQKSSEDVATAAEVLDGLECKKEANVLRCKYGQCSCVKNTCVNCSYVYILFDLVTNVIAPIACCVCQEC